MAPYLVGLAVWIAFIFLIVTRSRQKTETDTKTLLESIAPAIGFEAHSITPHPSASNADVAQRNLPVLSAFARYANSISHPGMSGIRDGVRIAVCEVPHNPKRTYYSAATDSRTPFFIIRSGKLLGSVPGDTAIGSKEPPIVDVGEPQFSRSFTTRGEDEVALTSFLGVERQGALLALLADWSSVELSNEAILLHTGKAFSGDVAETERRANAISAVAKMFSGT